ncbi:uncharacterized protein IWZ02DRAFT_457091 [Phyllosticta citriasiana]|uniref:RmlD-like substrate binding domain-containing protein n=1 Tax=Phyllosticta citriasiana TaxID=595635 RepID=A0ABR1KEI2_9PEZI
MPAPGTALITGGTGLLGRQVVREFESRGWKAVGTGLTRADASTLKLDLLNYGDVEKALDDVKPDVIVHCAANRFPDSCSSDPHGARAINAEVPGTLARLASRRNIFLLYISTDYVFPGTPGEAPYSPAHLPEPPNMYGLTKWQGEKAVLEAAGATEHDGRLLSAVLRVPVLYGKALQASESAVNVLVEQILKAAALAPSEPRISMDHYAQRYPTNTSQVARVCFDLCELYTGRRQPATQWGQMKLPGIVHFSSEDKMTKFEICQVLADILGLPLDGLEPYAPSQEQLAKEESEGKTKRPYDCHLDTAETKALGIDVSTVNFKNWWRKELGAYRH